MIERANVHIGVTQKASYRIEAPVLYGRSMRAMVVHILAVLLIAIFAIGAPPPALAECAKCVDCSTRIPAKNEAPCPERVIVCQVATTCANQIQKMPVPAVIAGDMPSDKAIFATTSDIAVKLAFVKPETSPPRA